jgi:hypothetical protein
MNTLNVLVVENDEDVAQSAELALRELGDLVQYRVARTLDEASMLMHKAFFHVAYVDLHLDQEASAENVDGKRILAYLRSNRKSCRRVLWTHRLETIHEFLDPRGPLIQGLLYKADFQQALKEQVGDQARRWRRNQVEAEGTGQVHAEYLGRIAWWLKQSPAEPEPTREEFDHLIAVLFGQRLDAEDEAPAGPPGPAYRLVLEPLSGGRSNSVVALCWPLRPDGAREQVCVLKFGRIAETREEQLRYVRHVRHTLSINRRVELYNYAEADTVAAVCYSFAGGGGAHKAAKSVEALFRAEDDRAVRALQQLFDPRRQEWYANRSKGADVANHFGQSYGLNAPQLIEEVRKYAQKLAGKLPGARVDRGRLVWDGQSLPLPTMSLVAKLRAPFTCCVVHGDLNAGNVIVTEDDLVALIDYRHTGPGPAGLDFAALESSARLFKSPAQEQLTPVELLGQYKFEREVWKGQWRGTAGTAAAPPAGWPYWARVAAGIIGLARANFPEMTEREYAVTALLWALRVFKVRQLPELSRQHLFLWLAHLCSVL